MSAVTTLAKSVVPAGGLRAAGLDRPATAKAGHGLRNSTGTSRDLALSLALSAAFGVGFGSVTGLLGGALTWAAVIGFSPGFNATAVPAGLLGCGLLLRRSLAD